LQEECDGCSVNWFSEMGEFFLLRANLAGQGTREGEGISTRLFLVGEVFEVRLILFHVFNSFWIDLGRFARRVRVLEVFFGRW
jgi:hypothetical protein